MTQLGPMAWLTGEYPRATDTFIQREVAALRAAGYTIETASVRRTGPEHIVGPEQEAEQAATFHILEATGQPATLLRAQLAALRTPARYAQALKLAWRTAPKGIRGRLYNLVYFAEATVLAQHLRSRGIVHLHNHIEKSSCTVAMLASAVSGIPYSFTLHGPDIFFAPEHWRLDEKIATAQFVACISNFARSQAMLFSDQKHWDKLHIIHCGVEPERYSGNRHRSGLVFVGRLAGVKGVPVLLEALALARKQRPDLQLVLVGDGPERRSIEASVRRMGLSDAVEFTGYLGQAEVAKVVGASGVLVLPSFAEGVPVVLMEGMASGLPVVATRVGGVSELVLDGECGLLVPPGDEQALADAILSITGDPDLAERMGRRGREIVATDFTARKEAERLGGLVIAYHTGAPGSGRRPVETATE